MLMKFHRGPLMAAAPANGGGGGGAFTDEQRQELSQIATEAMNNALNAWQSSFTAKQLPALFKKSLTEALPDIQQGIFQHIQDALPSDEELEQLELEGANGGEGGGEGGEGQYRLPPEVNAELLELRRYRDTSEQRLSQLEQEREENAIRAEQADRSAAIQGFLNKYPFANDASRNIAFQYFFNNADRNEEGDIIAGNLPIDRFIEENMGNLSGLLASRPVGGAGSQMGNGRAKVGPQMEDIGPGMKPEDRDAAWNAAVSALPAEFARPR